MATMRKERRKQKQNSIYHAINHDRRRQNAILWQDLPLYYMAKNLRVNDTPPLRIVLKKNDSVRQDDDTTGRWRTID